MPLVTNQTAEDSPCTVVDPASIHKRLSNLGVDLCTGAEDFIEAKSAVEKD